jgi:RNA 2',3'-cyclic 3'-phosphodiesterase
MSERARLFVALELADEARAALERWRAEPIERLRLRAIPVAQLHITLAFLGSLALAEVERLGEIVCAAARPVRGLSLGAPLWLPRRRPNLLAVEIEDTAGELAALRGELAASLSKAGLYEPDRRRPLAHVTVARGRPSSPRPVALSAPTNGAAFAARALTLFRSHTLAGGARYDPLRRVAL